MTAVVEARPARLLAGRSLIWWAVLAVAACGVVATAHGLFEVVAACGVLAFMAALYVPITDGLALVAYAATGQLEGLARVYAWAVVLLAAGLSGTAQAVMLGGLGEPPVWLRYVVGAWPALAVAIAAHLLWLVGHLDEPAAVAAGEATSEPGGKPVGEPAASEPVSPPERSSEPEPEPVREPEPEPVRTPLRAVPAAARPRPTVSRKAGSSAAKYPCDAGCGKPVSKATRTRHRTDGCPAVATTG